MSGINIINNESSMQYLNQLLLEAAEKGRAGIVKALLDRGADVNAVINGVSTPLYAASQEGHADVVKLLIEYKADLEIKASNGFTALCMAVFNKHINVINLLLKAGASTESTIKEGYTPIHIAAIGNYFDGVKSLMKSGANKDLVILNKTPLDIANKNGNIKISMLLKGYDVENDVNKIDELLCTVASYGDIAMAIQFLDQGANANTKCSYGISPLEASILGKHKELSDALIKYGAEVISEADLAIRSFHSSAISGDSLSIALALKKAPEIRERLDNKIIQEAAQNGHKDVVQLFLSGLDVFCNQTKDIKFAEVCGQEGFLESY